jgi:hypothetical protein
MQELSVFSELGALHRKHGRARGLSLDELASLVEPAVTPNRISNLERRRPRPCLTISSTSRVQRRGLGSNQPPPHCKCGALPALPLAVPCSALGLRRQSAVDRAPEGAPPAVASRTGTLGAAARPYRSTTPRAIRACRCASVMPVRPVMSTPS